MRLGLAAAFLSLLAQASPLKIDKDAGTVAVTEGGRPLLTYRYGDAPFKPYVKTFCTPAGVQVLRDSPADHVHHRGIMYAVEVDKVDFWSEGAKSGKQVHVSIETSGDKSGVRIVQKLNWVPPGSDKPLLAEERRIEVYGVTGPRLLTWSAKLRPAEGIEKATITGSHYQGLGLRFVQSMDGLDRFLHAARDPGPAVRGSERVTPSAWSAYTAPADGKPVTVAVFDHPKNLRAPAGMFTMFKPFSYLAATPNVWKNPFELKSGETLDLRCGVALWDGEPGREEIGRMHKAWLGLVGE